MKVLLDPSDLIQCVSHAHRIVKFKYQHRSNKHDNNRQEWDTVFEGKMAEVAVGRVLGLEPDWSIGLSDGGIDFTIDEVITAQVKRISYEKADLIFDPGTFKAHIAIAVYFKSTGTAVIKGFVTRDDFFEDHFIKDYGYGNRESFNGKYRDIQELIDDPVSAAISTVSQQLLAAPYQRETGRTAPDLRRG